MLTTPVSDIPLQTINSSVFKEKRLSVSILRTDLYDPLISGNKWFKLKYNLLAAAEQNIQTLISFGGPYSNHLHALAAAGKKYHLKTIGIIRGEEHLPLNPTLADAQTMGMSLFYINRQDYRQKHHPLFIAVLIQQLKAQLLLSEDEAYYLVPEGGTNSLAIKGAAEICSYIPRKTDFICVACGTGGTMAGIIHGLQKNNHSNSKVLGFPALKGAQFLENTINTLLQSYATNIPEQYIQREFIYDYHFGGFGRMTTELARFIIEFEKKYSIPLDPVYTAKMMYAIVELINNNYFPPDSQILIIHTGGLQGRRGMDAQIKQALTQQS